jgi:hypothetical protein
MECYKSPGPTLGSDEERGSMKMCSRQLMRSQRDGWQPATALSWRGVSGGVHVRECDVMHGGAGAPVGLGFEACELKPWLGF